MDRLLMVDKDDGFIVVNGEKKHVHDIEAQDIADALEILIDHDDCEIGDYEESDAIKNPATKIIYQQLHRAFQSVIDSRDSIKNDLSTSFSDAETRYLCDEKNDDSKL